MNASCFCCKHFELQVFYMNSIFTTSQRKKSLRAISKCTWSNYSILSPTYMWFILDTLLVGASQTLCDKISLFAVRKMFNIVIPKRYNYSLLHRLTLKLSTFQFVLVRSTWIRLRWSINKILLIFRLLESDLTRSEIMLELSSQNLLIKSSVQLLLDSWVFTRIWFCHISTYLKVKTNICWMKLIKH